MEINVNGGEYSAHMRPTGTNYGLTRIFVDTRAANAAADGSAGRPYRTVEQALRLCPEILALNHDGLMDLRIVMLAGVFDNLLIDRPVALKGVAGLFDVEVSAAYAYICEMLMKNANFSNHTGIATVVHGFFEGTLEITTPSVHFNFCNIISDSITLDPTVTGTLVLINCNVSTAFTIPASWTVDATNSYLADATVTGTLNLYNSTNGHQG